MTLFGKWLALLLVLKVYMDGGVHSYVWIFWNPLAWIMAPIIFILAGMVIGFPIAWKDRRKLGFGVTQYYVQNPDELKWLSWKNIWNYKHLR